MRNVLNYESPQPRQRWRWLIEPGWPKTCFEWLVVAGIITLLVSIFMPFMRGPHTSPYHGFRGKCMSNLRQIAIAISLYANDHGGAMPTDLVTLATADRFGNDMFVCPASGDVRSVATQPSEVQADFAAGHCSYTYVGRGPLKLLKKDDVVAFDTLANHAGDRNVLFGDQHIESLNATDFSTIVAQQAAGTWPIRLPATRKPTLRSPR